MIDNTSTVANPTTDLDFESLVKFCSRCKIEQPLSNFHKDKRRKDGKCIFCKICIKKETAKNSERQKEYSKKYYKENLEKIKNRVQSKIEERLGNIGSNLNVSSELKTCRGCEEIQPIENFSKDKYQKEGLSNFCRSCKNKRHKEYRIKNPKKIKEDKKEYYLKNHSSILEKSKKYYSKNLENIKKKRKIYGSLNREKINRRSKEYQRNNYDKIKKQRREHYLKNTNNLLLKSKEYQKNNSKKILEHAKMYLKNRKKTDLSFRITCNLRRRLYSVVINKYKSESTLKLLGCPLNWLILHLESKFYNRLDESVMSWDNYGPKGWHIDHIKPCASFDLSDPIEQQKCFHWTNLQPLWAEDNMAKSDKIL